MDLQKKDFIISKINWNEKYDNINFIVKNLNLRFEDCIFIDDNILEINKVKNKIKKNNYKRMINTNTIINYFDINYADSFLAGSRKVYSYSLNAWNAEGDYKPYIYLLSLIIFFISYIYNISTAGHGGATAAGRRRVYHSRARTCRCAARIYGPQVTTIILVKAVPCR